MSRIRVTREEDGTLVLADLPPTIVVLLGRIESLLDDDPPDEVRRRLCPQPSDDAEHRQEWERFVHPDLFALVSSSRDVVARDLGRTSPAAGRVAIPEAHVPAWIHALNAARLALAELHDVGADELELGMDELGIPPEKLAAVRTIELYGWIQGLLILGNHPELEEEDGELG